MTRQTFIAHPFRHALAAVALFALAACVTEPPRQIAVAAPPPPDTNVYFYPAQGRAITAEQQDRDRYECNAWAVQGTGFDPSLPNTPRSSASAWWRADRRLAPALRWAPSAAR